MSANEDTVRRGYDAFGRGDMDTLRSIMTPDVVQSVPGKSQIAGEHKGIDNVLGYYAKLGELSGGTLNVTLETAKDEGADKVLAVHHSHAERNGTTFDEDAKLTFTFAGGKIARLDEAHDDIAEFDAFWS